MKISRLETHKHCTASCTSKPSSVSITPWCPIYTLQTSRVLHVSCIQSAQVYRGSKKLQHTTRSFLVCFSLWSPDNAAQQHSVRQTNTCVLLAKNPSCVLSCVCLAEHPLSCVCFSEMFLHESALAFHLCPLQENTPSHVCPSKAPSDTADSAQNP